MHDSHTVTVPIELGERRYDILINQGLWNDSVAWQGLPRAGTAVIVTNTTVAAFYASRLTQALGGQYGRVLVVELPDGEVHKDWASLNLVFDRLLAEACDRKTVLYA